MLRCSESSSSCLAVHVGLLGSCAVLAGQNHFLCSDPFYACSQMFVFFRALLLWLSCCGAPGERKASLSYLFLGSCSFNNWYCGISVTQQSLDLLVDEPTVRQTRALLVFYSCVFTSIGQILGPDVSTQCLDFCPLLQPEGSGMYPSLPLSFKGCIHCKQALKKIDSSTFFRELGGSDSQSC